MDIDKVVGSCPVEQVGELLQAVWNSAPGEVQDKFVVDNAGEISAKMPDTD